MVHVNCPKESLEFKPEYQTCFSTSMSLAQLKNKWLNFKNSSIKLAGNVRTVEFFVREGGDKAYTTNYTIGDFHILSVDYYSKKISSKISLVKISLFRLL